MTKMKRFQIILIQWNDAVTTPHYLELKESEHQQLAECQSVGFLIKNGRKTITLASLISSAESIGNTTVIPKSQISKISTLRLAEAKK